MFENKRNVSFRITVRERLHRSAIRLHSVFSDLRVSFFVGYFERITAFLVNALCLHETFPDKWCLHKSVRQTGSGLEQ